jgi:hypothetical protein
VFVKEGSAVCNIPHYFLFNGHSYSIQLRIKHMINKVSLKQVVYKDHIVPTIDSNYCQVPANSLLKL